jgi:hypothetical protein
MGKFGTRLGRKQSDEFLIFSKLDLQVEAHSPCNRLHEHARGMVPAAVSMMSFELS